MKKTHPVPRYESIKVLKDTKLIPFKKICFDLIDNKKILKALKRVEKYKFELGQCETEYKVDLLKIIFNCTFKLSKIRPKKFRAQCYCEDRIIVARIKSDIVENKATICHELAHLIQYDNDVYSSHMSMRRKKTYLSEIIRFEQQAETLAYELSKIIYPEDKITKKYFIAYFSERDIKWIAQHYYEIPPINDLYQPKWEEEKKMKSRV